MRKINYKKHKLTMIGLSIIVGMTIAIVVVVLSLNIVRELVKLSNF